MNVTENDKTKLIKICNIGFLFIENVIPFLDIKLLADDTNMCSSLTVG